jgi:hypothetical protein
MAARTQANGNSRRLSACQRRAAVERTWHQAPGAAAAVWHSIPALPGCRAEGLRPHTLGGLGSCLFRRRPAATPKRRRQLSGARGHLPPWPPTRRAARSASLCRAISNAAARQRARSAPQGEPPGAPLAHRLPAEFGKCWKNTGSLRPRSRGKIIIRQCEQGRNITALERIIKAPNNFGG